MSAPGPSRLKLALVVAALFLAGGASGFALRGWLPHHPPARGGPPWLKELDLTEAQRTAAQALFERHRAEVDALMKETFPRVRARNEQMERELSALLTPEQRRTLEAIRARRPPRGGPGAPDGPGAPGGPEGPPPGFDGPPPPPPPR